MRSNLRMSALTAGLLIIGTSAFAAQQPPPIDGVTGTLALEGSVQKTHEGLNALVVKTLDGIEHLFHLTERTVVHGGNAAGDDVLRGLDEGSKVVVQYTIGGEHKTADEVDRLGKSGLTTVEGVITRVDRRAKTMSIQLADGSRQNFHLTERAAANVGSDVAGGTTRVVVYVNDEAGRAIAHFFKRSS